MKGKKTPNLKTLGPISAKFIEKLTHQGKTIFTLEDAAQVYKKSKKQTSKFLGPLVKRNIIAPLKSGKYVIQQMGYEKVQMTNWPIIARELIGENNYFISHYSAMRLHGMTTHPLYDIYITVSKRVRPKSISGITYHFIYSKAEHFWGHKTQWVSKHEKVMVSDIERTILDGLDRPDLSGGMNDVVRGIWAVQEKIDWEKLVVYAKKFRTQAAVKRLGFILETLALAPSVIPRLINIVAENKSYVLLDPLAEAKGQYLGRWHIQMNMNIDELKTGVWG